MICFMAFASLAKTFGSRNRLAEDFSARRFREEKINLLKVKSLPAAVDFFGKNSKSEAAFGCCASNFEFPACPGYGLQKYTEFIGASFQ
jgi:hypothetical protein